MWGGCLKINIQFTYSMVKGNGYLLINSGHDAAVVPEAQNTVLRYKPYGGGDAK